MKTKATVLRRTFRQHTDETTSSVWYGRMVRPKIHSMHIAHFTCSIEALAAMFNVW